MSRPSVVRLSSVYDVIAPCEGFELLGNILHRLIARDLISLYKKFWETSAFLLQAKLKRGMKIIGIFSTNISL